MCGVFGATSNGGFAFQETSWVDALLALGRLAEERGVDSSGIGTLPDDGVSPAPWAVRRTLGRFSLLADQRLREDLGAARTVLGHTRSATQGAVELSNASPMRVGTVLGTHNGDVATDELKPLLAPDTRLSGDTDTEVLLAAIASTRPTLRAVRDTLASVVGRASLVWVDSRMSCNVWLARAGLSPLWVARDAGRRLVWASNPRWLREVETNFSLGLSEPHMIREGNVLCTTRSEGRLLVRTAVEFQPTVRRTDIAISNQLGWHRFTVEDRQAEETRFRHRVAL